MTREEWNIGLTPNVGSSSDKQQALDWWHSLPIQDIEECRFGWANLLMKYYPNRTECYHFTEDEVLHMYKSEYNG